MKLYSQLFLIIFFAAFLTVFIAVPALAQQEDNNYGLDITAGEAGVKPATEEESDLPRIIGIIIGGFLGFLGFVFLIVIILGGLEWMMSGGSEEKVMHAKSMITKAIYGMVVILMAWALAAAVIQFLGRATGTFPSPGGPPTQAEREGLLD